MNIKIQLYLLTFITAISFGACKSSSGSSHSSQSQAKEVDYFGDHKLGVYIGTFDPPHKGHTFAVTNAISQLNLTETLIIANPRTPHKPNALPYKTRQEMTKLAFADVDRAVVATESISDDFDGTNQNRFWQHVKEYYPNSSYFLILGDDGLENVERLPMPDDIRKKITFAVSPRGRSVEEISKIRVNVKLKVLTNAQPEQTSSTKIRDDLCHRRQPKDLEVKVFQYIIAHGFYTQC